MPPVFDKIVGPPNSTGSAVDNARIDHGDGPALRQVAVLGDAQDPSAVSAVKNVPPDGTEYGLLVRTIGGAGGGPATVADGADVAEGATTDAAVTSDVAGTVSAKLRGLVKVLADVWDSVNHRLKVDGSGVTQPVSAASLPLPTGAATEATLATRAADATLTGGTAKSINRGGAKGATAAADVTSTAQGVDHQALDVQLMHGGAAKDPTQVRALTASDVVTAQQGGAPWGVNPTAETAGVGVGAAADAEAAGSGSVIALLKRLRTLLAGGLPAALDGSGFLKVHEQGTATVSGTVTANAGTNLNTSALAVEAGGNLAAIKTDVDKIPADPAREGGYLATIAAKDFATSAKQDTLHADLATLDVDLKAEIGTLEGKPAAYTVLDRLSQIQRSVADEAATMRQVLAAVSASKAAPPQATTTLLHRR